MNILIHILIISYEASTLSCRSSASNAFLYINNITYIYIYIYIILYNAFTHIEIWYISTYRDLIHSHMFFRHYTCWDTIHIYHTYLPHIYSSDITHAEILYILRYIVHLHIFRYNTSTTHIEILNIYYTSSDITHDEMNTDSTCIGHSGHAGSVLMGFFFPR